MGFLKQGTGVLVLNRVNSGQMVIEHHSLKELTDWIPEQSTQMYGFMSPTLALMTIRRSATSFGKVESIGLAGTPLSNSSLRISTTSLNGLKVQPHQEFEKLLTEIETEDKLKPLNMWFGGQMDLHITTDAR